ncbi:hypothetical protein MHEL_37230 [Mycolicibacterium helvum]|uniref:Uncharacterized protein n=1 Tax=Mycolicibacterium helvum TaxID=1534349 RepID=A0A7I7T929_9MYCO|nr:hypothetical protein MHEL_37230 [Mycolicibacterium helvum]
MNLALTAEIGLFAQSVSRATTLPPGLWVYDTGPEPVLVRRRGFEAPARLTSMPEGRFDRRLLREEQGRPNEGPP